MEEGVVLEDRREEMARVHEALRTAGLVAPLDVDDPGDVRRWVHCDLASMVEGGFDVRLDPLALGQAERDAWLDRLRGSYRLRGSHVVPSSLPSRGCPRSCPLPRLP